MLDADLIEHEVAHSWQWLALGPVGFPLMYGAAAGISQGLTGKQCLNPFEWAASFQKGDYGC